MERRSNEKKKYNQRSYKLILKNWWLIQRLRRKYYIKAAGKVNRPSNADATSAPPRDSYSELCTTVCNFLIITR